MRAPELPASIRRRLKAEEYRVDTMGLSGSAVLVYPSQVLKIQPDGEKARNEVRMLRWLRDKLPVPAVDAWTAENGTAYLLMERCGGTMSCDESCLDDPETLVGLLSGALKALWAVDIADCPSDQTLPQKLALARYRVEHGLVDTENTQPDTYGPGGFRDPEHLLEWLESHRPAEDLVLSHGDFSLPNVFGAGERLTGLIDLGLAGVADRWCDIAICYRSLSRNLSGWYGGKARPGSDPGRLFDALGVALDEEKLRYYILLDELF